MSAGVNLGDGGLYALAETLATYTGLSPEQIWPISPTSAPFLTSLWVTMAMSMYLAFFRAGKGNAALKASLEKRKDLKIKKLQNTVFLENVRLEKKKDKAAEEKAEKDGTGAEAAKKENGVDDVAMNNEEPPRAKALFELVFETVEEQIACEVLAIDADDPVFLRCVTLFKKRVAAELDEAVTRTAKAQTLDFAGNVSKDEQMCYDFMDGEKLSEAIEFTKEKAIKFMGKHVAMASAVDGGLLQGIHVQHFDAQYLDASAGAQLKVVEAAELNKAEAQLMAVRAAQKSALTHIYAIARPVLPTYLLGLLFMIVARCFEAPLWAGAWSSYRSAIPRINPNATSGEFGYGPVVVEDAWAYLVFFGVGFLFSRPIEIICDSLNAKAQRNFAMPLRSAVMRAIMQQDTEYFDFNPSSKLTERLNHDTNELIENMLWVPRMTLENFFRSVQRCTTLWFCCPKMLYACLYFNVPMFCAAIMLTAPPLRRLEGQKNRANEQASLDTTEILQNIKTVRQFSMERQEEATYSMGNQSRGVFEDGIRAMISFAHNFRFTMHIVGEAYVIWVALSLVSTKEATVDAAIVASMTGMWLQHDFKNLMEQIPKCIKIMTPVRRVASLLAAKPRIEVAPDDPRRASLLRGSFQVQDKHPATGESRSVGKYRGRIEFRDVCFSFPTERQKTILNGLNFTAEPGQKVAFVGQAGCGKSTSMCLLQRFYNPTSGQVLIDGKPIEQYDVNHLRQACGVVSQDNVLFSRSIYENVVYGMLEPPLPESEEFIRVCKQAQCWDFINSFPNKQYTYVGEKGVKLSGGQKQRVAIARVIIRKPTFLFLDEATSALDALNEKAVQAALDDMLKEFNGVAIVVAHRLTTICNCDKIVVMGNEGKTVEEGTHEQLLKVPKQEDEKGDPVVGPGLYHTLWDTQQMDGAEDSEMSESLHTKLELQEIRIRMLEDENALLRGEVLTHQVSSADHERAMDSVRAKRKLRNAVRFMMGAGMKASGGQGGGQGSLRRAQSVTASYSEELSRQASGISKQITLS